MKERLEALYKELETLLNSVPMEEDCIVFFSNLIKSDKSEKENIMCCDIDKLKETMFDAGYGDKTMKLRGNNTEKMIDNRISAQKILSSNKSDDLKLFEVFQIYKENIQKEYTELYYALLGWKDNHLKELQYEQENRKTKN